MAKKLIILTILILILGGGGFFYWWWQDQAEVRELNKDLPEGVRVVKDLRGDYWLIHKIDGEEIKMIKATKEDGQFKIINDRYGYEIIFPQERKRLWRLEYLEKIGQEEMEYVCRLCKEASILFVGLIGGYGDHLILESYKPIDENIDLEKFTREGNPTWLKRVNVEKDKVGDIDVIKTNREFEWGNLYKYFLKGESNFYLLENVSEEFIRYIIANGKW